MIALLKKIPGFTTLISWITALLAGAAAIFYFLFKIKSKQNKALKEKNQVLKDNAVAAQDKFEDDLAAKDFEIDREKKEKEVEDKALKDIKDLRDAKDGDEFKVDI